MIGVVIHGSEDSAIRIVDLGEYSRLQKERNKIEPHLRCFGLNVCAPLPNFFIENLMPRRQY